MIGPFTRETKSNDFRKVYALNFCNSTYHIHVFTSTQVGYVMQRRPMARTFFRSSVLQNPLSKSWAPLWRITLQSATGRLPIKCTMWPSCLALIRSWRPLGEISIVICTVRGMWIVSSRQVGVLRPRIVTSIYTARLLFWEYPHYQEAM